MKKIKLDKKDCLRALLTDTYPGDVPIIFSNDGLYINSHIADDTHSTSEKNKLIKLFYMNIVDCTKKNGILDSVKQLEQKKQSHPLKYKIMKNDVELRTLSLLHPRAQKNYCEFYREYAEVITYLCSLSPFSIRAPEKIGNSLYLKESDFTSKYKEINIDTLESELIRKHASSFFSYKGFDRLHKLYNSNRYITLEKQYSSMWFLDVANCFDSIYTHTISWAVKNKEFIKDFVKFSNQFSQELDTLTQRSNNNETNGIPVGAEVSRIFAEVIFQSIDLDIIKTLSDKHELKNNVDYVILRYVDDYRIFTKNDNISETISLVISDCLSNYNLYISKNKIEKHQRPFFTDKSNIIIGLQAIISDFESSFFDIKHDGEKRRTVPKKIFRKDRLIHNFIDKVKSLCKDSNNGYSDVSSYLVSVFSKRIIALTVSHSVNKKSEEKLDDSALIMRDALSILLELMFFFYTVHIIASASNSIAKTIIIIDKFVNKFYPQFTPFIRTLIMDNIQQLSLNFTKHDNRDGYISLERLNVVLATTEFGKNYLISSSSFEFLVDANDLTYFDIVSFLYYFKTHEEYKHLVTKIEKIASNKLDNNFLLHKDSESAHLFLDLLTCPYISHEFRKKYLKEFYKKYDTTIVLTDDKIEEELEQLFNIFWFVKWKDLNLLKLLERKELKSIY